MALTNPPPFLLPGEIIRGLANALDIKQSNKHLDEISGQKYIGLQEAISHITAHIQVPLKENVGERFSILVMSHASALMHDYYSLAGQYDVTGVDRDSLLPILIKNWAPRYLAKFLNAAYKAFHGPMPSTLVSTEDSAVNTTINWLENNIGHHNETKTDPLLRQHIYNWKHGRSLPSLTQIKLISNYYSHTSNEKRENTAIYLLIARMLDWLKKEEDSSTLLNEARLLLWGANPNEDIYFLITNNKLITKNKVKSLNSLIADLEAGLNSTRVKNEGDAERLYAGIQTLRLSLKSLDLTNSTQCWLDWQLARWHVYSGDIETANQAYKVALDGAIFRSGFNQKTIIEESLTIATNQKNPDIVFIKKLKLMAQSFGYDSNPSALGDNYKSNKASVDQWDIQLWQSSFKKLFPDSCLFPGAVIDLDIQKIGPLIYSTEEKSPDLRNKDRVIKTGSTWTKRTPQLVYFTEIENFESVQKLLEKGADVNALSESNDSAILVSLRILCPFDVPYQSLDDRFFKIISEKPHKPETINQKTLKKLLTPLISAVETGRKEIVEKIISMGASIDLMGHTTNMTALYRSLTLISSMKNPDTDFCSVEMIANNKTALDAIRRNTAGHFGPTLEDQYHAISKLRAHPIFHVFKSTFQELKSQRLHDLVSVNSIREIAIFLLAHGANPNAKHHHPIEGYTPLMFAAELDEAEIFSEMLSRNGDPNLSYVLDKSGKTIDCKAIATHFRSTQVLAVLADWEKSKH